MVIIMADGYEIRGNTVRVYFRFNGELCREKIGTATKANIDHAKRLSDIVNFEITAGTFDYGRHFPNSHHAQQTTFNYYLDLLLSIKKNQVADSSYRGYAQKSNKHIRPKWGQMNIEKVDHINKYIYYCL